MFELHWEDFLQYSKKLQTIGKATKPSKHVIVEKKKKVYLT